MPGGFSFTPLLSGSASSTQANYKTGLTGTLSAATDILNVVPMMQYLASGSTTLTEQQFTTFLSTINGFLKVSLGDDIAGEDRTNNRLRTFKPNNFTHLNTLATTVVKNGAGTLSSVTINDKSFSSGSLTLYDNTAGSGTVIAVINPTTGSVTLAYDIQFSVGLTSVSAGSIGSVTIAWW